MHLISPEWAEMRRFHSILFTSTAAAMQKDDVYLHTVELTHHSPFLCFHMAQVGCQLLRPAVTGADIKLLCIVNTTHQVQA